MIRNNNGGILMKTDNVKNDKPLVGTKAVQADPKAAKKKDDSGPLSSGNVPTTKPEIGQDRDLEIDNSDIDQSNAKQNRKLEITPGNPGYSAHPDKSSGGTVKK